MLRNPLSLLWNGWIAFSHALGIVMSTIILTILWIVGFGLYAVILRIVTLPSLFRKSPESYWIEAKPASIEEMRYPF